MAAMFDLTQKKKKKKPKKEATGPATGEGDAELPTAAVDDSGGTAVSKAGAAAEILSVSIYELDPPTYTYSQLLNRVVEFVHEKNPELTDKKRFTMKPPQLMRGNKSPFHCSFR